MTRLPPYTDEPARTDAVMALIGREIRRHLGGKRKPATFDLRGAVRSLEAAGKGGTEPLPNYLELNPQSADRPSVSAPDEAAAGTSHPTAASLSVRHTLINALTNNPNDSPMNWRPTAPYQTPSFSPSFLSHVKQNGGLADCAKLCGVSLDWFTRNVDDLTADDAFPAPVTQSGQRRWALARVHEWAEAEIATAPLRRARAAHNKTLEKQDAACAANAVD